MTRTIYLLTTSDYKYQEFVDIFNKYGITIKKDIYIDDYIYIKNLIYNNKPLSVMYEQVYMYDYYTNKPIIEYIDCLRVNVEFILYVWYLDKEQNNIISKIYNNIIEGYIDLSKKSNNNDVFGWDDIFIVKDTTQSYYEKKKLGYKVSARDQNISQYIIDYIYYKNHKKFNFTNISNINNRTIDFNKNDCIDFYFQNKKLISNKYSCILGIDNLFKHICNTGIFFRSAKNRRENIYWCPGLNAGIPHIQKKDKIHELTFTIHDFFHFLIPDLIFDGIDNSLNKKVYIISRMLSEAITIVFSDMLFIDTIREDGVIYDWNKRKIWPLFNNIRNNINIYTMSNDELYNFIHDLILSNVTYCLMGDDSHYMNKISNNIYLNDFKEKYMPFFVEDYKWTNNNWNNMISKKEQFIKWWNNVKDMRDKAITKPSFGKLETITEYINRNNITNNTNTSNLIYIIYNNIMYENIIPYMHTNNKFESLDIIRNNGFSRWIIGQMFIFSKFSFIYESNIYANKIKHTYINNNILSINQINAIRGFYEQYLNILKSKNLISHDDEITYAETYPIFDPSFTCYDNNFNTYENLNIIWKNILKN